MRCSFGPSIRSCIIDEASMIAILAASISGASSGSISDFFGASALKEGSGRSFASRYSLTLAVFSDIIAASLVMEGEVIVENVIEKVVLVSRLNQGLLYEGTTDLG